MKRLTQVQINQLKEDARALPDYDRPKWWHDTLVLLSKQGFTTSDRTRKSIDNIVYK
jgi:hypothetical protein